MARKDLQSLQPPASANAETWAGRITACWRASFEGVLETGRLLMAAKNALPHGQFGKMIESQLPFKASTAERLMAIAADERISNAAHAPHLPQAWTTLYELTKLDDSQFDAGIEQGLIRPDMDRKEAINGARTLMSLRQEPPDSADFFPTPPWGTRALVQTVLPLLLPDGVADQSAWEPGCGEGHMAEALREYFKKVIVSDLYDYGYAGTVVQDFTKYEGPGAQWIITNPPFGDLTEAFVLKALNLAQVGVAMFVRLQWLETIGRYENIFRDRPPTIIAFFCERINLCKGRWEPKGGTATAYIWLVWMHGKSPLPPFWIPPGQRERLTHPDDAARFTAKPVIRKEDYNPNESRTSQEPQTAPTPAISSASAPEPASTLSSAPQPMGDAGSPSLPELILPGMAPTFETIAAFVDLTSAQQGRTS